MKVVTHISYAVYTNDSAAWNPRPPLVYHDRRKNAYMKSVFLGAGGNRGSGPGVSGQINM